MEVKLTEAKVNASVAADRLVIPEAFNATASKPATGPAVPYQWVIRRPFIGTYLDSDVYAPLAALEGKVAPRGRAELTSVPAP